VKSVKSQLVDSSVLRATDYLLSVPECFSRHSAKRNQALTVVDAGLLPYRFLVKIDFRADGCWIWKGSTGFHPKYRDHRYGQFMVWTPGQPTRRECRKMTTAHRFAYECVNRVTVPKGEDIDHICREKLCVNPEHLQAISHKENCVLRERRQWS